MRYGKTALTGAIVFTWLMVFASCAAYSAGRGTLGGWLRLGASVGFVLTGFAAGGLNSRYGRAILVGLFFGWWGDFFLTRSGSAWFMAGLVAFLVGHVAYSCAFVFRKSRPRWAVGAFTAIVVAGIFVAWWLWPHLPAGLHAPALAYGLAISVMVALAVGTVPMPGGWLIAIGAVIFLVSDVGVAYAFFIQSNRAVQIGSMLLYYLGQTMLAASIALVRRNE